MFNSLFKRKSISEIPQENLLHRNLNLRDLSFMGIAAVVGAGIFSTIGNAAYEGGPGVVYLFIFTAFACLLSALCYAEFASSVPVSGSAYTYAYVSFGELIAWIIGWDLLMEYAIGNIAVAISWSDYFTAFLQQCGFHFPEWLSTDYNSAQLAFQENKLNSEGYRAFSQAPTVAGFRFVMDLPATLINICITILVWIGIKESKTTGNMLVYIKLLVLILILIVAAGYISTDNWTPFIPNGWHGVFKGTSAVFFAYIGFDAISTTSEEALHPKRDLPRAMFISLLVCTVLYILLTLVLTGTVHYSQLNVADPFDLIFKKLNMPWMVLIVSASAVVAMTSVLLVFQLGQPRIFLSMSRDGLLPKWFSQVHPRFKTPGNATIVTGLMVGIPILFLDHKTVTDLCSIGTLFAFAVVCAGCMLPSSSEKSFKVYFISSRYLLVPLFLIFSYWFYQNGEWMRMYRDQDWPLMVVCIGYFLISISTINYNFSLIPTLGLMFNLFLIAQLQGTNWMRFGIWLGIGLVYYVGRKLLMKKT
jgi:amino acid transporter